jgi:hypothetical protein
MRHEKVDPVEWFAKVERLEADLCAMTKSRDDWQRRYMEGREGRRQLEGAVSDAGRLREAIHVARDALLNDDPARAEYVLRDALNHRAGAVRP